MWSEGKIWNKIKMGNRDHRPHRENRDYRKQREYREIGNNVKFCNIGKKEIWETSVSARLTPRLTLHAFPLL